MLERTGKKLRCRQQRTRRQHSEECSARFGGIGSAVHDESPFSDRPRAQVFIPTPLRDAQEIMRTCDLTPAKVKYPRVISLDELWSASREADHSKTAVKFKSCTVSSIPRARLTCYFVPPNMAGSFCLRQPRRAVRR